MTSTEQEHFDRLAPQIQAALRYGGNTHTLADVADKITDGHAQFWWGEESAIVTQIETTPQRKTLRFWLAGGKMGEVERMYRALIEWGKLQGCTHASLVGRKGWERSFLKEEGWKATHVVFEKELTNE